MDKLAVTDSPIVLVNMPFVSLHRPSLGLGILKAVLAGQGLAARVEYANLRWAHQVGLEAYAVVNSYPAPLLLGEWVFSGSVFPDFEPDHDAFLNSLDPVRGGLISSREEFVETAWSLRRQAGLFIDDLASEIVESGAKVVGCTSTFVQNLASLGLLKKIRELAPEVSTVMGGANCEGVMGQALLGKFPWLDYVVSGEADNLVAPFFEALLQQGRKLREVPYGVLSRGAPRLAGPVARATISNLDEVPMPDFDDYFLTLDRLGLRSLVEPSLAVETSRGCWWGQKHHCTFCGLNGHGMGFRSKSPELALEQFHTLSERYDCRQFMMTDNILDMSYFKTVLPQLAESSRRYQIFYETKANLKRAQLESCARAGVSWIQPGLETLSDPLLELMDKGTTALTNLQTLKWCRELGIHVTWLALFAFPGDRYEWYEDMLGWVPKLLHLQPPQGVIQVGFHRLSFCS
jgi:ribosomal peptide maturation radical SAM protein 1